MQPVGARGSDLGSREIAPTRGRKVGGSVGVAVSGEIEQAERATHHATRDMGHGAVKRQSRKAVGL